MTHYCVTNMPGAVPITSTYALTNATMPYVLQLAGAGVVGRRSRPTPASSSGVNVAGGQVTYAPGGRGGRSAVRAGRGGSLPAVGAA